MILQYDRDEQGTMGAWIKHLDMQQLDDTKDQLDGVYIVIRHSRLLAGIDLGNCSSPSLLAILTTLCSATLTYAHMSLSPRAMPSLTYIAELQNLRTLILAAPGTIFNKGYGIRPWSLPNLQCLVWATAHEQSPCSTLFLSQCQFPSLVVFRFRTPVTDQPAANALIILLKALPKLQKLGINAREVTHAVLLASLPSQIEELSVMSPTSSLVTFLPSFINQLVFFCVDVEPDMQNIYSTLDKILEMKRMDIIISIAFWVHAFRWNSISPDTEDLPVDRGELVRKLVWYSMQGLEIRDDDGKTIKECLP
jgi:hypothetical protein